MKKTLLRRALVTAYAYIYMVGVAASKLYKSVLCGSLIRGQNQSGRHKKCARLSLLSTRGETEKELLLSAWMSETV